MAIKNRSPEAWHVLANNLFLAYVRDRLGKVPRAWGTPPEYMALRRNYASVFATPQAESTRLAVKRKDQFANAMAACTELPDATETREQWAACMRQAETDIAAHLAASA